MATLYRDNEYVPQIGGVLRDSVTLSLHDAGEIEAFGVFCGETLADDMGVAESLEQDRGRMRRIHDRMSAFDVWQNGRSREADAREFQRMLERSEREVRSVSAQLVLSLAAARETVIADAVKGGRLLALVSIRPQWIAESSRFYEADEPAVVFHEGSWRCSLTWFDEHSARFILSAGSFAVALVRAAVAPGSMTAAALARDVRASAWQRARHRDLAQLERLEAKDVATRKGFILLLHGLFSTDVATFDGFIDAWLDRREFTDLSAGRAWGARCGIDGADPAAIRASVEPGSHDFDEAFSAAVHQDILVVGWAHDTLTSIKENAVQLLRQIDARLGATEAPIALVCHSRGGLLARKLAVLAPERIRRRLTLCVTFGTPHEGAPFAEREKSLVGLAAMMVLTGATRDGASLMQLLAYLRQERRIAGVEDLARSDVSRGRFLEALRDEERYATGGAPRERELPSSPSAAVATPPLCLGPSAHWHVWRPLNSTESMISSWN